MKSDPLIVLDSHYLCHRAFHAQGNLTWKGISTGVIFGFLKSIASFKKEFQTDLIAFCFEGSTLYRSAYYKEYKSRHRNYTPEERKHYQSLSYQIEQLRMKYLPEIGFRNIFYYPGYESDDVMAMLAKYKSFEREVILVTADSDLFQCLAPNVIIYSPQKQAIYTEKWFRKKYGIKPHQWALVKAIGGCHSDNVPGIEGVGEKTALKWVRGEIKEGTPLWEKITGPVSKHIVRRNRKLVELPYEATPLPEIYVDRISQKGWLKVCDALGMRSIAGHPPIYNRKSLYA